MYVCVLRILDRMQFMLSTNYQIVIHFIINKNVLYPPPRGNRNNKSLKSKANGNNKILMGKDNRHNKNLMGVGNRHNKILKSKSNGNNKILMGKDNHHNKNLMGKETATTKARNYFNWLCADCKDVG